MGITNPSTQKRAPPLSLRTQKDIARQSPQSRLRSRSYSHDNELYRMGLRKNAEGEWAVVDNLPTAGIANAMRELTRVKKERMEEVMWREDTVDSSVDMADSTAVYEEIRVYMEDAPLTDESSMDVDEPSREIRGVSVMSMGGLLESVEVMSDLSAEEGSGETRVGGSISEMRSESLASISEVWEETIQVSNHSTKLGTFTTRKRRKGLAVHVCDICGDTRKQYSRAEHLRRHMQTHAPPSFICRVEGCEKAFHRQDLLERHVERHNEPQPQIPAGFVIEYD